METTAAQVWHCHVYVGSAAAVASGHPQSLYLAASANDIPDGYEYPEVVRFEIEEKDLSSYLRCTACFVWPCNPATPDCSKRPLAFRSWWPLPAW